ncbi:hypothetical protein [Dyella sp.]|uniref:hypothetical protein n=1 Tax=Dyella sp. TaxID=1869338 RepID=UPI002ED2377E
MHINGLSATNSIGNTRTFAPSQAPRQNQQSLVSSRANDVQQPVSENKPSVVDVLSKIPDILQRVLEPIATVVTNLIAGVTTAFNTLVSAIASVVSSALGALKNLIPGL